MEIKTFPLVPQQNRPPVPRVDFRRLLEDYLAGRNERTGRAYERDLEDSRAFLGSPSSVEAAMTLMTGGPGEANALDLTNGNIRAVARFSRHRDLRVLNVYHESREDLGGKVARLVASEDSAGEARRRR